MSRRPTPTPGWTGEDQALARLEGWGLFDCDGSENGRWQFCRYDDAEEASRCWGVQVPQLASDDVAHRVIANGKEPYHGAAREFAKFHNPDEYAAILRQAGP